MRSLIARPRRAALCGIALAVTLGVLLGAAQQGALRHEIGHVAEKLAAGSTPEKRSESPKGCEQCIAFAAVAGAVAVSTAILPPIVVETAHSPHVDAAFTAVAAPLPRSRGPPFVL